MNEVSARIVAGFVVLLVALTFALGQDWLMFVIAYGFFARVLTGPTLSPLAQLVTRVITPRLPLRERPVAGPPKRFAQGMGAVMSGAALIAHFGFGAATTADSLLGLLAVAASAEAFLGFCAGCWIFAGLMRAGLVPESTCERCADLGFAAQTQ